MFDLAVRPVCVLAGRRRPDAVIRAVAVRADMGVVSELPAVEAAILVVGAVLLAALLVVGAVAPATSALALRARAPATGVLAAGLAPPFVLADD